MCTRTARLSPRQMQPQSNVGCVFFSLFISYDGHRVSKRRGLRVGALAVAVAVGVAAVAGRKSRTRGELSESERRTNRKPRDFNSQSGDFEFGLHTPLHWPVRECVSECASVCVYRVCLYLFNVVVLVLALGVFYGAPPEYLPLYNGVLVPASRHCRRHHRRIKSKLKPRSVSHKPVESTQS